MVLSAKHTGNTSTSSDATFRWMRKRKLRETKEARSHFMDFAQSGSGLKCVLPRAWSLSGLGWSPELRLRAQDSLPIPACQPPKKGDTPCPLATECAATPWIREADSQRVQTANPSAPLSKLRGRPRCLRELNMTRCNDLVAWRDLTA